MYLFVDVLRISDGLSVTGGYLNLASSLSQLFLQDPMLFFYLVCFLAGLGGPSSTGHSQALQMSMVYLLTCGNNFEERSEKCRTRKIDAEGSHRKGDKMRGDHVGLVVKVRSTLGPYASQSPKITNTGQPWQKSKTKLTFSMRFVQEMFHSFWPLVYHKRLDG